MVKVNDKKWAEKWEKEDIYSPNLHTSKHPFYNLMMFPYPSAEGMHVGNMYAFTGADIHGRFKRMQGDDVFEPIGLDGFGIHSENYAIKVGRHPKEHAKISEKNFYRQLSQIGNGFAWEHRLETYDPDYYRWTQWLFVQMFKAGLAYKAAAMVNWCPSCKTVLADEQVVAQKPTIQSAVGGSHKSKDDQIAVCERCGTKVEKREMSSWFFRITKYADRLLANIEKINWPEKIKTAQRQWIGKAKGLDVNYKIEKSDLKITVWTKFWETVFGTTFLALAPEHPVVSKLRIPAPHKNKVSVYIKMSLSKSFEERKEAKDKTGVFTGLFAVNPVDGRRVPLWIADYVLADVGTGAVMGVPAHDERDFEFAKKFDLDIIQVVSYSDKAINRKVANKEMPFEGEGKLISSGQFDGMDAWGAGKQKMAEWMIKERFASWRETFHLRDWLISRQRYWGPPIPMIYCKSCALKGETFKDRVLQGQSLQGMAGWWPVPEEDLPVLLPDIKDFKPKGNGTSPLHNAPDSWKKVKCPNCGKMAERELDVSDTFLDSAWYFLRYPSTRSARSGQVPWDPEITKKWLPVNAYIGGAEHAVLHLLYSRFVWMMLGDHGFLPKELGDEPFPFLYGHGLLIKDGAKMSKSRGNIVVPDTYIDKYGADTLRCYLMFLGPYDQGGDFRDTGIEGMNRFMNRIWKLYESHSNVVLESETDSKEVLAKMHQTIKKVTEDIEGFRYNTAIAAMMEFVNLLYEKVGKKDIRTHSAKASRVKCAEWDEALQTLCLLLAPFAPFMAEEVWCQILGKPFSVHTTDWPKYREEFLKVEETTVVIQVNGKLRSELKVKSEKSKVKSEIEKLAQKDKKIAKWLEGKKLLRTVFVPEKLINFVTN